MRYRCRMRLVAVLLWAAGCAAPASSGGGDLAVVDLAGGATVADLTLVSDLPLSVCGNGDCEPGENGSAAA